MNDKPKILIVEDDELNRLVYKSVLSKNFDLVICKNDEDFFNELGKECLFDAFLIDLTLKGKKDGIQIITELREVEKYKNTPVIVITAHAYKRDEELAMAAGANKFLRKPIDNKLFLKEMMDSL
jgi:CheY-like chemotaxis protein